MEFSMNKFAWWERACERLLLISAMAAVLSAQTFTTLAKFNGANGGTPETALKQGIDGNFYGTTSGGGANKAGTIFKITPEGALIVLYSFIPYGPDGWVPQGTLVLATDGSFYGITVESPGTVFRITPAGVLTTIYHFCFQVDCADGGVPYAGLLLGANGNFYGTTTISGANGRGTIFDLTPGGSPRDRRCFPR